jgi:hypothetical protein
MMDILSTVTAIGVLVINSLIAKYLYDLDANNCECATSDYRRNYIFGFTIYLIVSGALSAFVFGGNSEKMFRMMHVGPLLQALITTAIMAAGIVNIVFVFQYVDMLKRMNCSCSESPYKTLMQAMAYISAIVYSLVIFGNIFVISKMARF